MNQSHIRLLPVAGLGLILGTLGTYVSYSDRAILGRWSAEFAMVLVVMAVLWGASVGRWWRGRGSDAQAAPPEVLASSAVAIWGLGYLATGLAEPSQAARLLDGNLFGSTHGVAIVTDWLAATLFFVAGAAWTWERLDSGKREPLLALMAAGLVLSLFELGARVKAGLFPATQGFPTHSSRIWTQRHVDLNSHGFRDQEWPDPSGGPVVLVVGDSFAFGSGVDDPSDRYGEQLRKALSERTGMEWTSVNASRGDTHTLEHEEFLAQGLEAEPELVVLLYVFNDIDYLSPVTQRPGAAEGAQGLLDRVRPGRLLFWNSYLYQEIYVRTRHLLGGGAPPGASPYSDSAVLAKHVEDLARFLEMAESRGAAAVLVPFEFASLADEDRARIHDAFVARAVERGLAVCTVQGAFEGREFYDLTVNRLDGHPNAEANRLAAEYSAPCLTRHLTTPPSPGGP